MSYNGSGTFNINTAGQPVVTGTVISSTAFNALTADLGTGLSTAITKDGQTVATARIPFAAGINSSLVTDATNTTTGSIITAGGVGIAKALFVGTTANIAGTATLAGVTATSITDSGLTSGRVTFASTSGLLADAAALAWDGTSLSATKFAGGLNGTVGATTPAAGAFTTLTASSTLTVTGAGSIEGLTVGRGGGAVATNTAVVRSALATNTTGANNTALGYQALYTSNVGDNTAVGFQAGYYTTNTPNTFIGYQAGFGNASGGQNVAVGTGAYASVSTTTSSGGYNSAFGYLALAKNTSGNYNTGLGNTALYSNTTASNNTAVGYQAGYSNVTGSRLSVLGYQAAYGNTSDANTAIGYQALYTNSTGFENTAIGDQAMFSNTTGYYNVAVGRVAGYSSTTGILNTYIGRNAGNAMTTGSKNTIIGGYNGNQSGLDIRTASNYIVLSDGDGNPKMYHNGSTTWHIAPDPANPITNRVGVDGTAVYPEPDNTHSLGYASYCWTTVYATTALINTSDANLKQDIANLDDAEKRVAIAIKSLIKKYRFKDAVAKKGDAARIHIGAVAQEVQAAFVAEGLDPARYTLFCSDTWYEVDGKAKDEDAFYTAETPNAVQVTQLGLRYEELLAFVLASL